MNERAAPAAGRDWRDLVMLAWDLGIIVLVSANLALILFDGLFAVAPIAAGIAALAPGFHDVYAANVHAHFAEIDLAFVAVFVLDVLAGWTVAVIQRRYYRWFFYPFVRWYDVLGCIPVAGFRFLRVLRVISIGFRLQKLGVIDVRDWAVFQILAKYYNIFVEEVSDRVVINVLSGVQEEIRSGGDKLPQRVVRDVIEPRKQRLVDHVSARVEHTVRSAYDANRQDIRVYLASLVDRAVSDNALARNIDRLPMFGAYINQAIDDTITDTVCNVLDEAVRGLGTAEYEQMIRHIADSVFEMLLDEEAAESPELSQALIETLDLLKEQVGVQRWKQQYS